MGKARRLLALALAGLMLFGGGIAGYAMAEDAAGAVDLQITSNASDWSSSQAAKVVYEGTNEVTADGWKLVSGTFTIPAHARHEAVMLKLVGSGGLTFDVDELKVTPQTGDEDLLSGYNTGFEGTDGGGNLYWWNDANWSPIAPKAYGSDPRPSEASGENFLEVSPDSSGVGTAQISNAGIAGILAVETTYKFSFYAKAAETAGPDAPAGDNLVINGNFDGPDLSCWDKGKGAASIESVTAADGETIGDSGITTYGAISGRTGNSDCFAQDMTGKVKSGGEYQYSFWVKLDGEDYKDAGAEYREICFAPFVTAGGSTTYWGSYSTGVLDGNSVKQIEAGQWTYFSGVFKPQYDGEATELVIRIIEQGPNYGSDENTVKGRYYLTGVELRELPKVQKDIEWDIPDLKDTVSSAEGLGSDAYTGVSIVNTELNDKALMDLVEKHFNAVTLGNELKPDAIFGYQNDSSAGLTFETVTWTRANGEEVTGSYPRMDFSLATKMLDVIKAWNDEHPEDKIRVRGHVLTWHSQTPEWFFHVDWDASKPYVSAEEMSVRHEWYIRGVLTRMLGPDSPYRDMFYGWDVVNEAVSDSTGTYRTDAESSSWWAVYKSNEYILNAFRWANYYARELGREDLELYYNDYNECMGSKVDGIAALLRDVKAHEGDMELPTRISGMGMQAHHTVTSPTANQIRDAAVTYGQIVGKVQLTELDLKASAEYDGTEATRQSEYTKQAYRYKEIYDVLKEVDAMEGIDVNAITIWGVIDGNSWLQDSSSVGGGSDGSKSQVPLLFDDDYKAKPAFWAFVDPDRLEPYIKSVVAMQALGGDDPYARSKVYEIDGGNAQFRIVWDGEHLKVKVAVTDSTQDEGDGADLYLASTKGSAPEKMSVSRAEAKRTDGGYEAEFTADMALHVGDSFLMDVVVRDGEKKAAFNDLKMTQDESSKYYASAMAKPYIAISSGTVRADGEIDAAWADAAVVPLTIKTGAPAASASARALWDSQYLYVLMEVTDPELDSSSPQVHEQDSVEVFIDENNGKTDGYEPDDKQYRVNFNNEASFNGQKCTAENMISAAKRTDTGYIVEAAFRWTDITPKAGDEIGFEMQINDGAKGTRIGTVSWYDESGQGWSSPGVFGTALLTGSTGKPDVPVTPGGPGGGTLPPAPGSTAKPSEPAEPSEPTEPTEPTEPAVPKFTDVPDGAWYAKYLDAVVERGLILGDGAGHFSPDNETTRGQLMTILARLGGVDTTGSDPWYKVGMDWAVEKGVSDGTNPEAPLTREQFITMLYRYMGSPAVTGDLSAYPDAGDVSDWAVDAMIWAARNGLVQGNENGELLPGRVATRAEAATILARFLEKFDI